VLLLACLSAPTAFTVENPVPARGERPARLLVGLGDRLVGSVGGNRDTLQVAAHRLDLPIDFLELWLTRDWDSTWAERADLERLCEAGIVPVIVHEFFGDEISRERFEAAREAWEASLARIGGLLATVGPALVVLEPEFNNAPPAGETPIAAWEGFGAALAEAAERLRAGAPRVRVGACIGDFGDCAESGRALRRAGPALDFVAFQEMRAKTAAAPQDRDLRLGEAALACAQGLHQATGLPVLLAYVAVPSLGGCQEMQAEALRDLGRRRDALLAAGVFGIAYMMLYDDPRHRGYFGAAEPHFGLLTADGVPKLALEAYRGWFARDR
jgi:hypothetical protein